MLVENFSESHWLLRLCAGWSDLFWPMTLFMLSITVAAFLFGLKVGSMRSLRSMFAEHKPSVEDIASYGMKALRMMWQAVLWLKSKVKR